MDEIVAVDELAATFLAANELQPAVAAIQKSSALAESLEDPKPMRDPVVHHWTAYRVYGALGDVARAAAARSAAEGAFEGRRDAIGDPSLRLPSRRFHFIASFAKRCWLRCRVDKPREPDVRRDRR